MEKENINVEKELLEEKMVEVEIELETVKIELENTKGDEGHAAAVVKTGGEYLLDSCRQTPHVFLILNLFVNPSRLEAG